MKVLVEVMEEGVRHANGTLTLVDALRLVEEKIPVWCRNPSGRQYYIGEATKLSRNYDATNSTAKVSIEADIDEDRFQIDGAKAHLHGWEFMVGEFTQTTVKGVGEQEFINLESGTVLGLFLIPWGGIPKARPAVVANEPLPPNNLKQEIEATLSRVNMQIDVVERRAAVMAIKPEELLDKDGRWPMLQLLESKSRLLTTLATMERERYGRFQ